jgi:hypothetical protein
MIYCSMQQLGRCSWLTLAKESKSDGYPGWRGLVYFVMCSRHTLASAENPPYHFFKHSSSGQSITTRSIAPKRAVFPSGSIVSASYVSISVRCEICEICDVK